MNDMSKTAEKGFLSCITTIKFSRENWHDIKKYSETTHNSLVTKIRILSTDGF